MCVFYGFSSERKAPFYPPALLTWKVIQEKVPWGIVLLLGGGFALAKGCEVSPCCRLPSALVPEGVGNSHPGAVGAGSTSVCSREPQVS